jgi:hypothetical protein
VYERARLLGVRRDAALEVGLEHVLERVIETAEYKM